MEPTPPGLPPHLVNQLNQAAREQRDRSRSRDQNLLPHSSRSHSSSSQSTANGPADRVHSGRRPQMMSTLSSEAFPPLGAAQTSNSQPNWTDTGLPTASQRQELQAGQSAARTFFDRARGRGRGQARNQAQRQKLSFHDQQNPNQFATNDYRRPAPSSQHRLYQPQVSAYSGTAEQHRAARQRVMAQSDYLNAVASVALKDQLGRAEIDHKHQFRLELEAVARRVMMDLASHTGSSQSPQLRLDSYGSLSNSFGTPGCDVDLLISVRDFNGNLLEVDDVFKRTFEGSLLEQGYGARLLSNTRVPIMKVCEKPSPKLLQELRRYRQDQIKAIVAGSMEKTLQVTAIQPPDPDPEQISIATQSLQNLDFDPADVPLPDSPTLANARLEFDKDCGVQADVNFTNHIALVNTRLLWTYGQCDTRVRQVGLFVKSWAKARDINTPYHGTLSSYGYILMVLHYLMNIVRPPILPNLQLAAKDGWNDAHLRDSNEFDTRFVSDSAQLRAIMRTMPSNHESLGALLRGFFNYYSSSQGFNWVGDVISLRTQGGLLAKRQKGWTGAKWSEAHQNVRLRYLLAIEDPFELEHNVGRTVGHHGIVAIRNEFRRAWQVIEGIQFTPPDTWIWTDKESGATGSGLDLIAKVDDRGDLLKRDADERKQKLRDMREKAERDEQEALATRSVVSAESEPIASDGTSKGQEREPAATFQNDMLSRSLIHDFDHQDDKVSKMRGRTVLRARYETEDDLDVDSANPIESNHDLHVGIVNNVNSIADENSPFAEGVENTGQEAASSDEIPQDSTAMTLSPVTGQEEYFSAEGHAELSQNHVTSKPLPTDMVGEVIAWSKKSVAGRWLRARDHKIREGSWKPSSMGDDAVLNAKFPYDPSMTRAQLSAMNEVLEYLYTDTLHPRLPKSSQKTSETHLASIQEFLKDIQPSYVSNDIASDKKSTYSTCNAHGNLDLVGDSTHRIVGSEPSDASLYGPPPVPARFSFGPVTQWSENVDAGQWLLWRDRLMAYGCWLGTTSRWKGIFVDLDQCFPFNPSTPLTTLRTMNKELESYFVGISMPRQDMTDANQEICQNLALDALQRLHSSRFYSSTNSTPPTQRADYSDLSPPLYHPNSTFAPIERTSENTALSSNDGIIPWTTECEVGLWLRKRDRQICDGRWEIAGHEKSVFTRLHELFPYEPNMSLTELQDKNRELVRFFDGVRLPRGPGVSAEVVLKGIIKLIEARKEKQVPTKARVLLDLFSKQRANLRSETFDEQRASIANSAEHRQLSALQRVGKNAELSAAAAESERVRQSRLAYFEKLEMKPSESAGDNTVYEPGSTTSSSQLERTLGSEEVVRRDSGAEGSWNSTASDSLLTKNVDAALPAKHVHFADFEKQADQVTELPGWRGSDVNTIVSIDTQAAMPCTLSPTSWQQNLLHDLHPHLRTTSIPPCDSFQFDARQLADIAIIRAGGNGCARSGEEFSCGFERIYIDHLPATNKMRSPGVCPSNRADAQPCEPAMTYNNAKLLAELPSMLD